MSKEDMDEDVFEDAVEEIEPIDDSISYEGPPLTDEEIGDGKIHSSPAIIKEVGHAEFLFFTNQFNGCQDILEKKSEKSMYHCHGYATVLSLKAIFTLDRPDVESAFNMLKKSVQLSSKYKKKESFLGSISKMVVGGKLQENTQDQLHAELCNVEAIFMKAGVTMLQEEGVVGFLKAGLAIKNSYTNYKAMYSFIKQLESTGQINLVDEDFVSGVYFGWGTLNLMMSMLPPRLLKLVNVIGMSADKKLAIELLEKGSSMTSSLRGVMSDLALLLYYVVFSAFMGVEDQYVDVSTSILEKCLGKYPGGAIFIFFQAKLDQTKKLIRTSLESFQKAVSVSISWKQFHHISFWEMSWCNSLLLQWEEAAKASDVLLNESMWSRSFYAYHKASSLFMADPKKYKSDIDKLMDLVPKYKQKIGGKSIPIEKFVLRKARKYKDQGNYLFLPGFEMLYMWGYFKLMGEATQDAIDMVDKEVKIVKEKKDYPNLMDDLCLADLIKGCLFFYVGEIESAESCFLSVIANESKIKLDHYVAPYARMELAKLYIYLKRYEDASTHLSEATSKYKKYSMENRLHFRVHILEQQLQTLKEK